MGWPRKNDGARLYQERKDKSFIMVITENGRNPDNTFEAIANVYEVSEPSLCSTSVSPGFLNRCKRVQWSDLPLQWQSAFLRIMEGWDQSPKEIKGFWKTPCT